MAERRRRALEQIVQFGDPLLRSPSRELAASEFDDGLRALVSRMLGLITDTAALGLAAPQLGILSRVIVVHSGLQFPPRALVNPRITECSEERASDTEGCLSIPGIIVEVERPVAIRLGAFDLGGNFETVEIAGLDARVVQHEIDHLDGILILDRAARPQQREALKALREGRGWAPQGADPGLLV
jgi:peptide deformylase